MVDSSVKNHGEAEYDIQICLRYQEIQVWPKFRSEVYLFLLLYINRSITKMFLTEKLLEMMDSSVKNLGEVESIISRSVLIRKILLWTNFLKNSKFILPLYMNWSITKSFPIETLLKMIDSSVRSPGEVESITFKSVLLRNFFVMDRFMYSGNSR